ncbi:restriction endonuclease [Bacillus sp. ISL-40]|uniref:restriction endonuclease n=1 Tax=Bacillus sp. ISL-40 TaxID=2819126 RepID=UPI001BEAA9C8|nr:restriction endonuclease [Bacillus sp. ISL-40]MBT2700436.1 restriction endonuclease [Bacillus sp. ISL-40]
MNCEFHKNWPMFSKGEHELEICIVCKIEEKKKELYEAGLSHHEIMVKERIKSEKDDLGLPMVLMYVFLYFATNLLFIGLLWVFLQRESVIGHVIGFLLSIVLTVMLGKAWKTKKIREIENRCNISYQYDYSSNEAEKNVQAHYPVEFAAYEKIREKRTRKREKRIKESREREMERRNLTPKPPTALSVKELMILTPIEFEYFIAEVLRKLNYSEVKVTKASGDFGVDVLCQHPSGEKTAIQCKRYQEGNSVGFSAIQEIVTAKQLENCARGIVITTSTFTKQAIESAEKLHIDLWDCTYLQKMLDKTNIKKIDAS